MSTFQLSENIDKKNVFILNFSDIENSVYVGYQAGLLLQEGDHHTFIGYQAGDNAVSATGSIILGYDLDLPSTTAGNRR